MVFYCNCSLIFIFQEVFKSKSMQEVSEDTLVSILRSSRLQMDEMDLYKNVREWATVNGVSVHHVDLVEISQFWKFHFTHEI